jgi:prefoldin subunit 5
MENQKMASSNNQLLKEILESLDIMNSTITSLQNDVIYIKKVVSDKDISDKDISFIEYEEKKESTKGWFFT